MIGNEDQSARQRIKQVQVHDNIKTTDLEILCDFTNETLERELPDQELGRFLVTTNFTKSDSSGAETMRLLHTTSSVGSLACR